MFSHDRMWLVADAWVRHMTSYTLLSLRDLLHASAADQCKHSCQFSWVREWSCQTAMMLHRIGHPGKGVCIAAGASTRSRVHHQEALSHPSLCQLRPEWQSSSLLASQAESIFHAQQPKWHVSRSHHDRRCQPSSIYRPLEKVGCAVMIQSTLHCVLQALCCLCSKHLQTLRYLRYKYQVASSSKAAWCAAACMLAI